jgi:hypothetical protein
MMRKASLAAAAACCLLLNSKVFATRHLRDKTRCPGEHFPCFQHDLVIASSHDGLCAFGVGKRDEAVKTPQNGKRD